MVSGGGNGDSEIWRGIWVEGGGSWTIGGNSGIGLPRGTKDLFRISPAKSGWGVEGWVEIVVSESGSVEDSEGSEEISMGVNFGGSGFDGLAGL